MNRLNRHLSAALVGLAAVAAAIAGCGGGGTKDTETTIAHPAAVDAVVLQVYDTPGYFQATDFPLNEAAAPPTFRLYGDGTVLATSASIHEWARVAPITAYRLSEEGVQAVLEAAEAAGLFGSEVDYGEPYFTDGGSTLVDVNAGGLSITQSAYMLGNEEQESHITDAALERRRQLTSFIDLVTHIPDRQPELIVEAPHPYEPKAVDVYASVWRDATAKVHLDWPGATPLTAGCTTVRGDELAAVGAALESAPDSTTANDDHGQPILRWKSDDRSWTVAFFAVLPGEQACDGS